MTLGVIDERADSERQWLRKHPEKKQWQIGMCLMEKTLPMEMEKKTTKEEGKSDTKPQHQSQRPCQYPG